MTLFNYAFEAGIKWAQYTKDSEGELLPFNDLCADCGDYFWEIFPAYASASEMAERENAEVARTGLAVRSGGTNRKFSTSDVQKQAGPVIALSRSAPC